jgi:predicted hotdog family 3-hydroxylacyl-ACP dehydratase
MYPALDTLIPHRPPMCWIGALTDCTEATATATACFTADHFAVTNGRVPETALIECVAQTVAAALGHRAQTPGLSAPQNVGMLTAISDFSIQSPPPLGKPLCIEVRELKRFGPMLRVAGVISCEGHVLASGELTLYA